MDVNISIDKKQLDRVLSTFTDQKKISRVLRDSVNASARDFRKGAVEQTEQSYNLKKKTINSKIVVRRAKGQNIYSEVKVLAVPLGLQHFNPKQGSAGLTVAVEAGRTEVIPHAFMATMPNGKTLPMVRKRALSTAARKYVYIPPKKDIYRSRKGAELPISRLMADPISEVLKTHVDKLTARASQAGIDKLEQSIEQLLDSK